MRHLRDFVKVISRAGLSGSPSRPVWRALNRIARATASGWGWQSECNGGWRRCPGALGNTPGTAPRDRLLCRPEGETRRRVWHGAPGDLRKYYREQVQDLVYEALTR
jgi:hypothetical protein